MYHWKFGIILACAAFASSCTLANTSDTTETQESETMNTITLADTSRVDVMPENAEAPVIDVSFKYECKIWGKRGDNSYPMNGKEVGHIEFSAEPFGRIGHASAQISQQNTEAVVVHWWCDLFSGIKYTLKVWPKQ